MPMAQAKRLHWITLAVLWGLLCQVPVASAAPRVLVSILPLHSLVVGIMQGVDEPELLIQGNQSPHEFSLRPSDMRKLERADLVIWVGPEVESSLSSLFAKRPAKGSVLTLTEMPGVDWLPLRSGAEWEASHDHPAEAGEHHHHDQATAIDSHIWLSPAIARRLVSRITELLCEMDAANTPRYRQNGKQLVERLERLDAQLGALLAPVREVPYVVFHDAYHYFERHFGLNAVGSVTPDPERQPGARHIHELRAKIVRLQARCVFTEPQFRPKLVATLIEGTSARAGQLDPLGSDLATGPDAYFVLMRRLARNMLDCLQ